MNKTILVGKEGKASMSTLFPLMVTTDNNLVVKSTSKKSNTNSFKIYTENDVENFQRTKTVSLNGIVIRWGTRVSIPEASCIVYNPFKAINNSSDKFLARKLFQNAGVSIPKLVTPSNFTMEDLPIIARPFRHKQGKNFVVIKDYGSFEQAYAKHGAEWYFSSYIDKDEELRVHCAHGRILSIMKKPKPADPTVMAWNHAVNDEAFEAVPWSQWNLDIGKTSLRACKALGLDFCGLDVVVQNGVPYVLEANTSPSLTSSEYNSGKYAKYFDWLFMKNEKREHWEFEDKEKAASLAWKDWMFEDREPKKKLKK